MDNKTRNIELRFDLDNFCHLLGIESIVKRSIPYREVHNYKGKDGWINVKSDSIDIKHLKSINKKQFNNVKAKYVYFYLLPSLIENPFGINYNKDKVITLTKIECEILLYSKVENDNAIIHLGVEKRENEEYYIPRTFFVEKVNTIEEDIYLCGQEKIEVEIKNRVILQPIIQL